LTLKTKDEIINSIERVAVFLLAVLLALIALIYPSFQ